MQRPDIALTVLGGFLGAGKTSLLNHLLRTPQRERVLVMVNDFGAINIDAELIASGAPGMPEGIISLTNGCVCCAVGGDLMQAFLKVLQLPDPPGRILVEASGVGDPSRIAQIGRAGAGFRCEGVVTVADAEAVRRLAADRYVGDTVRAQLRAADPGAAEQGGPGRCGHIGGRARLAGRRGARCACAALPAWPGRSESCPWAGPGSGRPGDARRVGLGAAQTTPMCSSAARLPQPSVSGALRWSVRSTPCRRRYCAAKG
ncbi:GTP-binding protein [Cupriavidus basilensis]